jgi:hypothetical protein
VTFYNAEAWQGRVVVPSWPALKPQLESTDESRGGGGVIVVH